MLWFQSGPDNASPQSSVEIMGESLLFKWTTRDTPLHFASNLGWQRNVTPAANSLPLKNGRLKYAAARGKLVRKKDNSRAFETDDKTAELCSCWRTHRPLLCTDSGR